MKLILYFVIGSLSSQIAITSWFIASDIKDKRYGILGTMIGVAIFLLSILIAIESYK